MTGYLHEKYAKSLAEFGCPRLLPKSQGWILQRKITGFPYQDAIGCYPLFACKDWNMVCEDLESIDNELVSLAVVTDPFGNYQFDDLNQCFNHKVIPFKQHFIVDLSSPLDTFISSHHRRYIRKALQNVQVERCQDPMQFAPDWVELYNVLIKRHDIRGISTFSQQSFINQLQVPGLCMFRAVHQEVTVGINLWYVHANVGYYHLGAYSDLGYQLRASFALFWSAIEYFSDIKLHWLNLGAGAGFKGTETDGLSRFKEGWSTGTRTAYFCSHIFDKQKYQDIVESKNIPDTNYFPAYRVGEFS